MFTGLIETIGTIKQIKSSSHSRSLSVTGRFSGETLALGESIAVDGVCVTVEVFDQDKFGFTLSHETLRRSTLGEKQISNPVHLERARRLGDRLGGHIVQGHIDGFAVVRQATAYNSGFDLTLEIPDDLVRYVVEKGSLAVQGVSLTVAKIINHLATLTLIPETLHRTYLGQAKPGERLNVEVDILAKYVEALLQKKQGGINEELLQQWGFK